MARSRNIKPSLFKNELLGEADPMLTILFVGLWCLADRDGRLEDRPKRIRAEIFPYRECHDINGYLTVLEQLGFIDRYQAENHAVIQVINFSKHQSPHKTEKPSELPAKPATARVTCKEPLNNESLTVKESLIPDSLIPDSLIKERVATAPRFTPPSVDDVSEYISENRYPVDPERFVDFYESKGWMVGKTKMKDWKAAVRTWSKRNENTSKPSGTDPNERGISGAERTRRARELRRLEEQGLSH